MKKGVTENGTDIFFARDTAVRVFVIGSLLSNEAILKIKIVSPRKFFKIFLKNFIYFLI